MAFKRKLFKETDGTETERLMGGELSERVTYQHLD